MKSGARSQMIILLNFSKPNFSKEDFLIEYVNCSVSAPFDLVQS